MEEPRLSQARGRRDRGERGAAVALAREERQGCLEDRLLAPLAARRPVLSHPRTHEPTIYTVGRLERKSGNLLFLALTPNRVLGKFARTADWPRRCGEGSL